MFSSSLRSVLFAVALSAAAVSATPSLSLKVAGSDAVAGVDNLKVAATITNTGDETLKILNDPRGPLSQLPTDTFSITSADGSKPAFTGVKVKYVPETALAVGKDDAFTVLEPGQSTTVEHDLSEAYNFTSSGEGAYDFEARNLFHIIDGDNKLVELYASSDSHNAKITGKLAVARPNVAKRATYNGCSSSQQSGLVSAASAAQSYVAGALSYLQSHTTSTTRYTTWFGTFTTARHNTVVSHFTKMNGNNYSSFSYDCTCTDSGTYAYVYASDFGHVYLCGAFWSAPNTGTDSRGGTLVHESSHFTANAGTDDHVYGQSGCKSLAKSDPTSAIDNADSHEYFAENNPQLS